MAKTKSRKEHYVDNKKLFEAMKDFKELCKENEEMECFLKIANGLSYKPNFVNYTYKDEMVSDGIENCLQYLYNFNPEKSNNPFAYFTQIIYYAFIRRIQKEKKQTHIKHRIIEKEEYRTYDTLPGDTNSYNIQGFDPMIMLPDTPVYKTKVKHKEDYPQGLDKFMKDDKE